MKRFTSAASGMPKALLTVGTGALLAALTVAGVSAADGGPPVAPTIRTTGIDVDIKPREISVERAERALKHAGLAVPEGWRPVHTRRERHDERPVTVVRYEPGTTRTLGGEHLTVVVDDKGTLLGYTRLTAATAGRPRPQADRAERAAFDWLRGFAAEHAAGLDVQWVDQHDEEIRDKAGRKRVVTGTKVKTRHPNGLYTWVIVGDRGTVLAYERDVRWDGGAGRRGTEMWLHDRWIAAHEGTGPQPDAPYALARR
ncbi:hypothetical protein [Planobispora longispora]|uniref:PepSY domain-containing protein n=1 Tax=Planobispora longispora TaxID=28887 RepID=A0A8J3W5W4_9ACTN|nr:hypothetical protein [Planobispora longispora]BFE80172.1 hypothetical protein GCM10020093_027730 [Planobispora longispora]GIH77000.1 hypothetical protein Plo01_34290 [Planobispora longispora]